MGDGTVVVGRRSLAVKWIDAFTDGQKKIVSVEADRLGGVVLLDDRTKFENPGEKQNEFENCEVRKVTWGDARHQDCTGKIEIVEKNVKGRVQLEGAAFTNADVGKEVSIEGDAVKIGGMPRYISWGDAKHHDCSGNIKSVEEKHKGKVQLEDEQEFENGENGLEFENPEHTALPPAAYTPYYVAPEVYSNQGTNLRSDIYSLAVLLAVLYKGENVPPGDHISRVTGPWPVGIPSCSDAPPWFHDLLVQMFEQNMARRPSAREVRDVLLKGEQRATAESEAKTQAAAERARVEQKGKHIFDDSNEPTALEVEHEPIALPSPAPPAMLSRWEADSASNSCSNCGECFGVFRKKHHCRMCGRLVCDTCSQGRRFVKEPPLDMPASVKFDPALVQRVCNQCTKPA